MFSFGVATVFAMQVARLLPGSTIPGIGFCPAFGPAVVAGSVAAVLFLMAFFLLPETHLNRGASTESQDDIAGTQQRPRRTFSLFNYKDELMTGIAYCLISVVLWGSEIYTPMISTESRSDGGLGLGKGEVSNFLTAYVHL